ncbi:hypothetical protein HY988_05760 [Candidatus Micrarchaeota archaeon]|nr:hypothetical protein [Candidatus Micrarchaeota archaeon]
MPNTYDLVNNAWKSTAKILFGSDIGELKEFEGYLKEAIVGHSVSSCFSAKPLFIMSEQYGKNSKFFDYSNELVQFNHIASAPVDINSIKDLDSLVSAIGEKIIYGANKVQGNSKFIEHSDTIIDSTAILNSSMIIRGKYLAYSYLMRDNEHTFGSESSGSSSHIVRCFYNGFLQRCFECTYSTKSSDCYFSYNLSQCTDCMFTFNSRAKRFMVGNVQLEKDSYAKLKSKLLAEITGELEKRKRLDFSIIDLMNKA